MLEIEEAQKILCERVNRISETEVVSIQDALGRMLAEDIVADMDQPPFPRSPLDGYAFRGEDSQGASEEHPVILQVIGKIYAGYVFDGVVGPGQAVRLMTGAPIPEGADAVIRQEDTDYGTETVALKKSVKPYGNYCYQGEDYKAGTLLVRKDRLIHSGIISILASLGKNSVAVYRKARIGVISTGDEVIQPGTPHQPGKIYDSNLNYLTARLTELGNAPTVTMHSEDSPEAMADSIRSIAPLVDLIFTTGGVSVGEKDIMHATLDMLGAEKLFWKVRIKPGTPTLAFVYDGIPVLSLSGNPYGAIANLEVLGRPLLYAMTGHPRMKLTKRQAKLTNAYLKPAGSRRFLRGYEEDGVVTIDGKNQSSGAVSAMADCNCLIEIPTDMSGGQEGAQVWVYPL